MMFSDINAQIRQRASAAEQGTLRGSNINAQIQQRASAAAMDPMLRGGGTPIRSSIVSGDWMNKPAPPSILQGVVSSRTPINRAGVVPSSTLAPASAFGGRNGGMGVAAMPPTVTGSPLSVSGISSSITSAGSGIIDTLGSYIPLAIKIILAVIVLKIVLWLVKGRR